MIRPSPTALAILSSHTGGEDLEAGSRRLSRLRSKFLAWLVTLYPEHHQLPVAFCSITGRSSKINICYIPSSAITPAWMIERPCAL